MVTSANLCQGGYVLAAVLVVGKITGKVMNGFKRNFQKMMTEQTATFW